MANDLWGFLNNLYEKRLPLDLNFKEHFIINRFLALHPLAFFAAVDANKLSSKLPTWAINYILWYNVPKMHKAPYRKYIKAEAKEKLSERRVKAVDRISTIFGCSTFHAEQTLTLLEKQGLNIEGS